MVRLTGRILLSNIVIALVLIFSKPYSYKLFLIGIPFIIIGEVLRLISSFSIRKNKELSTTGPYAICRNPLYLGTFLNIIGAMIQITSKEPLRNLILWAFIIISFSYIYYKTIKSEEEFLSKKFGEVFKNYKESVPCLIPKLSCLKEIFVIENYSYELFLKNKEWRGVGAIIIIEILIYLKISY
jgi:protein-S-isoprenylcysteine O-methyltransferase Ste14